MGGGREDSDFRRYRFQPLVLLMSRLVSIWAYEIRRGPRLGVVQSVICGENSCRMQMHAIGWQVVLSCFPDQEKVGLNSALAQTQYGVRQNDKSRDDTV